MKVFIMGLPESGRTTIAEAICDQPGYLYVDATASIKKVFADNFPEEKISSSAYHDFVIDTIRENPSIYSDALSGIIKAYPENTIVIDGIFSPKDLSALFDYNQDVIVFLNRIENEVECEDYESISVSVSRDYCFWLSSAGLLPREKWLEYNFKIPGVDSDRVKILGSKNSVYIIKSIDRVTLHLKEMLACL